MFKKLKDKIAEEVKISPQRLQQLTQSVADKIQNTSVDDSFFSITDDDSQPSNSALEPGFSNVPLANISTPEENRARRNSNTSVTSDMSYLPRYDSSVNLFHLQSDMDISASEVEDNASTSSQAGHLSKEQIYSAFNKSQMRYHKYRGRYTDLAKHYKELERENAKMKSVLVETQDKALRRIEELREQCSLEQKAKAHLENALRVELDERQYVIDTLRTKVNVLQKNMNSANNTNDFIDLTDKDSITKNSEELPTNSSPLMNDTSISKEENLNILLKDLKDARIEIENLNEKLQELKANAIVFHSKENDLKQKIFNLEKSLQEKVKENADIFERERENNIKLAECKLELHTEIQNKDIEIAILKRDLEAHKIDVSEKGNTKLDNLQFQNANLIEKIERLTEKCNNYEHERVKLEQLKIENENINKNVSSLKQQIEQLTDNNIKLENELVDLKKTSESTQADYSELLQDFKKYKDNFDSILEENTQLKQQLTDALCDYETKIKLFREDTTISLLTLENKIRDKFIDTYAAKEKLLTEDFHNRIQEISSRENDTKGTELMLVEKENEVKNLSGKLHITEEKLKQLEDSYKVLETNHLQLIEENSTTRNDNCTLEKENSALEEEVSQLQGNIRELENVNTELQTGFKCSQKEKQDLQNELTMLQDFSSKTHNENRVYQEETTKLQCEISDLRHKLDVLENEKIDAEQKLSQELKENKYEELERELETVKNDKANLSDLLQQKIADLKNLKKSLDKQELLKSQMAKKESLLATVQVENTEFQEKLKHSLEEILIIKSNVAHVEEKNTEILKDLGQCKEKLNNSNDELRNYEIQIHNITQDNINYRGEISKLQEEWSKSKNEVQNTITEKLELVEHLKAEKEKYNESIVCIKRYEVDIAAKTNELEDLKIVEAKYSQILDENHNLKEQISQIEVLRGKVNELQNFESMYRKIYDEYESYKQKTSELRSTQEELSKSEKGTLNQELEDLKMQIQKLKEQISMLQVIEDDYHNLLEEKTNLVQEITLLQNQISDISNEKQKLSENTSILKQIEKKYGEVLAENEEIEVKYAKVFHEISELTSRNNQLSIDYKLMVQENEALVVEINEIKLKCENYESEIASFRELQKKSSNEKQKIDLELERTKTELEHLKATLPTMTLDSSFPEIITENKNYKNVLSKLQEKYTTLENEKSILEKQLHELDHHYHEIQNEKLLLQDEVQELKISPINLNKNSSKNKLDDLAVLKSENELLNKPSDPILQQEIDILNDKLTQYKSLDLTNRSSIEFYKDELQKMNNTNEKLNRKLDETIVTLNHFSELSHSTEIEYLKNVLYNYMLGKESLVLAKVIATVCKFDPQQTEQVLQKEQQKQTLLGHLGIL